MTQPQFSKAENWGLTSRLKKYQIFAGNQSEDIMPRRKRKVPASVKAHILEVKRKHDVAIRLIDSGIVDTKLRDALKDAGCSYELVLHFLTDLKLYRTRRVWIQMLHDDFKRMLDHYAVLFNPDELITLE